MVDGPNMYNFCGGDPVNHSDPMGTDYIDVEDNNDVVWVIENDGYFSDDDVRRVWLGKLRGDNVLLRDNWGGGAVSLAQLKEKASSFWSYHTDISGDSVESQDGTIKGLVVSIRKNYKLGKSSAGIDAGFVAGGLKTGAQAIGNAAVDTVVSTATLGQVDDLEAFGGKEDFGYDEAYGSSRVGTEILVGIGTGALGSISKGGKVVQAVGKGARILDTSTDVSNVIVGTADAVVNEELNWNNGLKIAGGIAGRAGDYAGAKWAKKAEEAPAGPARWVDENASMSNRAAEFDAGAPGARSNVRTQRRQVPALDGPSGRVKFDGLDGEVLVDRKLAVVTSPKARNQALRQSAALRANGRTGRWEVPNAREAGRARTMFADLGITNIAVEVVDGP